MILARKRCLLIKVFDVINVITPTPNHGIAVFAHCTSSNGDLNEIKRRTKDRNFLTTSKLLAVESSYHDFTDADKIQRKLEQLIY
jgi:hypothetical protein